MWIPCILQGQLILVRVISRLHFELLADFDPFVHVRCIFIFLVCASFVLSKYFLSKYFAVGIQSDRGYGPARFW